MQCGRILHERYYVPGHTTISKGVIVVCKHFFCRGRILFSKEWSHGPIIPYYILWATRGEWEYKEGNVLFHDKHGNWSKSLQGMELSQSPRGGPQFFGIDILMTTDTPLRLAYFKHANLFLLTFRRANLETSSDNWRG